MTVADNTIEIICAMNFTFKAQYGPGDVACYKDVDGLHKVRINYIKANFRSEVVDFMYHASAYPLENNLWDWFSESELFPSQD